MNKKTKDGISIMTVLDKRRVRKNGLFPVKVQVCYKRVQKHYPTGITLSVKDWESLPTTRNKELKNIREAIDNSFSHVHNTVLSLADKGNFSFDAFNILMGKGVHDTVNNAIKAKISELKKDGRLGTASSYSNTLMQFEKFGGKQISFDAITIDWLKRFEKFILIDKCLTTVGYHMRGLKAIMNSAKEIGIIKEAQFPFGKNKYMIKTVEGRKKALTVNEILSILKYSDGTDTTEKYLDMFKFMFYANGINVADLIKLKFKDIEDGEICFVRQKTERTNSVRREIRIVIIDEIQAIIDKWGNEPKSENYIFPFLSGKPTAEVIFRRKGDVTRRINRRMKLVGEALGIDKLSTYVARHTYATVLQNSGISTYQISKNLGHSDIKTTENYLAGFEKKDRIVTANILSNIGKKNGLNDDKEQD